MEIRFFIDHETGAPHIYEHSIMEEEVLQVLRGAGQDLPGSRGSRIKIGRTAAGRILKVVYARDSDGLGLFVITAMNMVLRRGDHFDGDGGESPDEPKKQVS